MLAVLRAGSHLSLISFGGAEIGRLKLTRPVLEDSSLAVFLAAVMHASIFRCVFFFLDFDKGHHRLFSAVALFYLACIPLALCLICCVLTHFVITLLSRGIDGCFFIVTPGPSSLVKFFS